VHPFNLPDKQAPLDNVEIELIPMCYGGQFRPWNVAERVKVEPVDAEQCNITGEAYHKYYSDGHIQV
jgi:hypothetical protein